MMETSAAIDVSSMVDPPAFQASGPDRKRVRLSEGLTPPAVAAGVFDADDDDAMITTSDSSPRSGSSHPIGPALVSDPNSADSYNQIVMGPHAAVFNTWLPDDYSMSMSMGIKPDDSNSNHPPQDYYSSQIATYSGQLLQLKRRLWPTAEECARICGTDPSSEWMEARGASNPLELLGEGRAGGLNHMFMNRSAIKLANLDAILKKDLTAGTEGSHFLFVDLCGAPGGFSEYIMFRCRTDRRFPTCWGYGMSLIGPNEHGNGVKWKLHDKSMNFQGFHTQYVLCTGQDGTGDLYNWDNILSLQQQIQQDVAAKSNIPNTKKVDLVVADGGFDAQRDSENQEELAQKLIVCQVAAGLLLLETGGKLVIKMFGFQKSTTRAVMRSLYEAFDQVIFFKQISSRPASSERYVVCRGFKGLPSDWDGPKWISSMLMGEELCFRNSPMDTRLHELINRFDRDLLALNIKTCFAILSYMERKAKAVGAGAENPNHWCKEPPEVNIDPYKQAWFLQ